LRLRVFGWLLFVNGTNVVIVDPPCKGLDKVMLQQLSQKVNLNQMYAKRPMLLLSHLPRHAVN
jgi:hypothetical protein